MQITLPRKASLAKPSASFWRCTIFKYFLDLLLCRFCYYCRTFQCWACHLLTTLKCRSTGTRWLFFKHLYQCYSTISLRRNFPLSTINLFCKILDATVLLNLNLLSLECCQLVKILKLLKCFATYPLLPPTSAALLDSLSLKSCYIVLSCWQSLVWVRVNDMLPTDIKLWKIFISVGTIRTARRKTLSDINNNRPHYTDA